MDEELFAIAIPKEHESMVKEIFESEGYEYSSEGISRFIVDSCIDYYGEESEHSESNEQSQNRKEFIESINQYIRDNPEQIRHMMGVAGNLTPMAIKFIQEKIKKRA